MAGKTRRGERRARGLSIAVRMAAVMAGLIVAFMVSFGLFQAFYIRDSIQREIMWAAYEAAYSAAHAGLEAWDENFGTPFQGLSQADLDFKVQSMTKEDFDAGYMAPEVVARRELNRSRFVRLIDPRARIVAAELADVSTNRLLAQSYGGALVFTPGGEPPLSFERGSVQEGTMLLEGRERHVIRGSYPVERLAAEVAPASTIELAVYIDAAAVDESFSALLQRFYLLGAAFLAVGAVLSWAVGKALMRPLVQLEEDMQIVASGDLAHRTVAQRQDEIGALAHAFDAMTQSLAEAQQREQQAAASRHQMTVAGEVASSLFPARLPAIPGFDLAGHHESSGSLGGDYYDVLELPGGRIGLLVGAASGTGVPAAMVMAMARSFIAAVARDESDPGAILRQVNALLSGDLRRGMYVTVLLAVLDPGQASLAIANAGHPPLLLGRGGGQSLAAVHSEGIALGFDKGPVFDRTLKVVRLELAEGDRAVLYTPGITRITGADGSALGEARFAGLVKREAGQPAEGFVKRVAATIRKFVGDRPLNEDVTLLTLGRLGRGS
ncbi:MAG TPA: PP2C family protein-serine/threonine phosphatase [Planctomycetota bacterium]|nr:PP2C family protein-serine/threonine phosphatase [Planctomycetota bacterium]